MWSYKSVTHTHKGRFAHANRQTMKFIFIRFVCTLCMCYVFASAVHNDVC